ncbi:hypothetical protein D3C75_1025110 [compost metagenome]
MVAEVDCTQRLLGLLVGVENVGGQLEHLVKVPTDLGMQGRVRLVGLSCGFDWCHDIPDLGAGVKPGCADPVGPAPAALTEEAIQFLQPVEAF